MSTSRNSEFRDAAQGARRAATEAYHWIDEGAKTQFRCRLTSAQPKLSNAAGANTAQRSDAPEAVYAGNPHSGCSQKWIYRSA